MIDKKWKQQNEGAYWAMQPGECEEDREARLRHYFKDEDWAVKIDWPHSKGVLTKGEWVAGQLNRVVAAVFDVREAINQIGDAVDKIESECPGISFDGQDLLDEIRAIQRGLHLVVDATVGEVQDVADKAAQLMGEV